jgi:hypothetical protein
MILATLWVDRRIARGFKLLDFVVLTATVSAVAGAFVLILF